MSYTGNPSDSPKDYIRFITGDTTEPFILEDAEINFLVDQCETVEDATIKAMEVMLPRIAKCVNEKVGDVAVSYSDWYENLKDAYDKLVSRLNTVTGIYVGGMTCSGVQAAKNANTAGSLFQQDRPCCETHKS